MNKIILLADINECIITGWHKNTGEVNARELKVEMCDELSGCAEQFVTFKLEDGTVHESKVINGIAEIPAIDEPQHIKIGLYTLDFEGDKLFKRYSPKPANQYVNMGSYKEGASNPPIPTAGTYADLKRYVDEKIGNFTISLVTEITEESTDEEIPSALAVEKLIAKELTAFKEKEVDYTKIYSYDAADLKSRVSPVSKNPLYSIEFEKKTKDDCFEAIVHFKLCMAYKDENKNLRYLVDTPLEISLSETGSFVYKNNSDLCDMGLVVDGQAYPFSEFIKKLTDDGSFQNGNIWFRMSLFGTDEISLIGRLKVESKYEQAIDELLTEVEGLLNLYSDSFLLYTKNLPETEIIQAQYIGGN